MENWKLSTEELPNEDGYYNVKYKHGKKILEYKMKYSEATKKKWLKYKLEWAKLN